MFSTARISEIRDNQVKTYLDLLSKSNSIVAFDSNFLENARNLYKESFMAICDIVDKWLLKHNWFSDDNYGDECMKLYEKFQDDCNRLNARFEKAIADDQRNLQTFMSVSATKDSDMLDWLNAEIAKMEAAK